MKNNFQQAWKILRRLTYLLTLNISVKNLSFTEKIILISNSLKFGLLSRGYINYLGVNFEVNEKSDYFTLLLYPHEISNFMDLTNDYFSGLKRIIILDIGANVGQFAITFAKLNNNKQTIIDSFEPNPLIFEKLNKNFSSVKHRNFSGNLFQYAAGTQYNSQSENSVEDESNLMQDVEFYYSPSHDAVGSIFKENATYQDEPVKTIKVKTISRISKITSRQEYDIVKIDVEGFEIEVLKSLIDIKFKYLIIEISTKNRLRNYNMGKLFSFVYEIWGNFDVIYCEKLDGDSTCFNVILEIF